MAKVLGARTGWLQGDGYAGYEQLYRKACPCIEVGCWAHARRYFVKAEDGGDKRARRPLTIIGELFAVEKDAKNLPHQARLAMRQARSCELLMRLVAVGRKNWLHCGSDKGAERLADIYSLLVTAKLQKADLASGLAFVFDQLGRRTFNAEEARELLPDRWPKAQTDFGRASVERVNPPAVPVPIVATG